MVVAEAVIVGTAKGDLEAEFRKFSSFLSARFLKEFTRFLINWRSAPAEERTLLHPLEMNEKAFSAVTIERDGDDDEDDVVRASGEAFILSII